MTRGRCACSRECDDLRRLFRFVTRAFPIARGGGGNRPSPAKILASSLGSIGPRPEACTASKPLALSLAQDLAISAGVLQNSRRVYIWAAMTDGIRSLSSMEASTMILHPLYVFREIS